MYLRPGSACLFGVVLHQIQHCFSKGRIYQPPVFGSVGSILKVNFILNQFIASPPIP